MLGKCLTFRPRRLCHWITAAVLLLSLFVFSSFLIRWHMKFGWRRLQRADWWLPLLLACHQSNMAGCCCYTETGLFSHPMAQHYEGLRWGRRGHVGERFQLNQLYSIYKYIKWTGRPCRNRPTCQDFQTDGWTEIRTSSGTVDSD